MTDGYKNYVVTAVSRSGSHSFSKPTCASITLLAGLGVEGDAHSGKAVKHRSRVKIDPTRPNLRQVHLIHEELFDDLMKRGFRVGPGVVGENITTSGIDLLGLPRSSLLKIGQNAVVRITGLRNPCTQLDNHQDGLMSAVLDRAANGKLVRKAGVMGVVLVGGAIRAGDTIQVTLPDEPHQKLEPV
jgi:MOSC domain-containing protein YiiM